MAKDETRPTSAGQSEEAVERVAAAMEAAEFGYQMKLVSLVDGVSTYTLAYDDGSEPLYFSSTEEVYEHVARKRRETQARAILSAIDLPAVQREARREALEEAAAVAMNYPWSDQEHSNQAVCWNASQAIAAAIRALKEGTGDE